MKIEIWSDVVCPWCYIGKRRFETALSQFAHRDEIDVEWKSFELDASAVSATEASGKDYADLLATKYAMTREKALEMLDSMTETAAAEGLDFHFERAVKTNTFDAHQVIHLAAKHGRQSQMKERLLRAFFTEGRAVGDRDTLASLAEEVGLDPVEVRAAVDGQLYADEVRNDVAEARALGVTGVPFFVVDRKYGISGAQPAEHLLQVLEQAWSEHRPLTMVAVPGAATNGDTAADSSAEACGPDGCSL